MKKNNIAKVSEENNAAVEAVATPVQQKETFWTKTKNFGKKHRKGLIAGAIAVVGTILICATRKGDDSDGDIVVPDITETDIPVEITEE